MQNRKKAQLVEGSVGRTLVKLTIPMIFGVLGMVAFNLADTFFVGQLGTNQLAAISFTFPVIMVLNSLSMGLGVGAGAVIARAIGEGDQSKVQRLTTDSLILATLVVAFFVLVGLMTIGPLFKLLGAAPEIIPLTKKYMTIWYLGMVFVVVPMVGNNAIRATGDTKTPSAIMLVAVVANFILDPLLIFGLGPIPRMELAGAAIATVIGRAITFSVALAVLYYREKMIILTRPRFSVMFNSWKQILYIGLPTAGTNMILPVGAGIITGLIATHGSGAVAAFGVGSRLDMLAMTIIMALSSVLGPFVGQNWGAGQPGRVKLAVKLSQRFALGWGAMVFTLFALAGRPIAGLFNDNPLVLSLIITYLWLVPLGYGCQGLLLLSNITLNVLNKPFYASILTLFQMFILYIPLAHLGSHLFGIPGIFGAAAVANITAGTAAYIWLRKILAAENGVTVGQAGGLAVAETP